MQSNAQAVREFTEGASGKPCPLMPEPMNLEEVRFIVRMVMSELVELVQTLTPTTADAVEFVKGCAGADTNLVYKAPKPDDPDYKAKMCAEQYDAFVDAWYYMLNAAAKKGCNLSKLFDVVHAANMAKRWPDGTFHRRPEDGKVIKPPEWREPDVLGAIKKQMTTGAWHTKSAPLTNVQPQAWGLAPVEHTGC